MKPKLNQFALLGFGGLLQIGLLMSCTNDVQETNNVATSDEEVVVPVSNNLTAADCPQSLYSWTNGTDYNVGVSPTIDDRSCAYNYTQSTYGSNYNWGVYRIAAPDVNGTLQTRIERESKKVNKLKTGNKVRFSGWCRILSVGTVESHATKNPTDTSDRNGTYIFQVKGKDDLSPADKSPAVCLFIAKAVRRPTGSIIKVNGQIEKFDIFREQIGIRNGYGDAQRSLVKITTVGYNQDFYVDVTTGFTVSGTTVTNYVNGTINGENVNWNAPNNVNPKETFFRMGAYRCWEGSATILWREGTKIDGFVNN
ncbi:hypothetical protein [Flavobacterium faecale]|uniref:hypothetical protein n=1 Tax=Flavobacterium faecale TaxID=1355330 RepID=UPI003AABCCFC